MAVQKLQRCENTTVNPCCCSSQGELRFLRRKRQRARRSAPAAVAPPPRRPAPSPPPRQGASPAGALKKGRGRTAGTAAPVTRCDDRSSSERGSAVPALPKRRALPHNAAAAPRSDLTALL
eukprot:5499690-Prymnesium_polylepis.1